jgi:hypothetical protein
LSTVLSLRAVAADTPREPYHFEPASLASGELRLGPDGWHAIVPLGGATHRFWLPELPVRASQLIVELPLDTAFGVRLQTAHRLKLALEKRPVGPAPLFITAQRRRRLILSTRAVDGWLDGNSYREIADGLFGVDGTPGRSWKTNDLRSRTIRLVRSGLALMRGGYRALLRPSSKKK